MFLVGIFEVQIHCVAQIFDVNGVSKGLTLFIYHALVEVRIFIAHLA